ncbi:CBN-BATH-44 protein [Caenorhabditis brenneri]|uniref:CBN-BATH-44 protein n=1 Tax=Caenorhabditis brenneri TaxID=135651 RepID=G0N9F3_CAEBE|nr:CBN-BATH-44 protein [Caenorhabditis brenneri]
MDNSLMQLKHAADSWSTSEVRSITHKHMWTIRGFSQLECRYLETSAKIKDISNDECRLQAPPSNQPSSSSSGLPELPDITFRIRLHPQGNKESNKDFTFFQCFTNQSTSNPQPTFRAKFKFSVHNQRGDETATTVYSGTQQLHGYFEYIRRELLISHVQPADDLHICLNITITFDTVTKSSQNVRSVAPELPKPIEVTKDLENLYRSGKHADFTFVVEGRELKAHKAILSARSPVFAAMMEPHTAESQNSRVVLQDIDYEVVQALLYYIYTGTCTNMGVHALEILAAAERYSLPGLKNLAEAAMRSGLAADTVCKHLAHADLYNMTEFKKEAIKFICMNANAVINSEGFHMLTKQNPGLIADIMSTLVNDRHASSGCFPRDGSLEPSSKRARMTETNL